MNITVTLTKDQWASVNRLMRVGFGEQCYYEGMDEEFYSLMSVIEEQTKLTATESDNMEPERNIYVTRGSAS